MREPKPCKRHSPCHRGLYRLPERIHSLGLTAGILLLEVYQLLSEAFVLDQPHAARGEQWLSVYIKSGAVLLGLLINDSSGAKCGGWKSTSEIVSDQMHDTIMAAYIRKFTCDLQWVERGLLFEHKVEDGDTVFVEVRNRQGK